MGRDELIGIFNKFVLPLNKRDFPNKNSLKTSERMQCDNISTNHDHNKSILEKNNVIQKRNYYNTIDVNDDKINNVCQTPRITILKLHVNENHLKRSHPNEQILSNTNSVPLKKVKITWP